MENDLNGLLKRYQSLPRQGKTAFLVAASFNLTLEFRGLCEPSDEAARKPASGLNELQHRLLSQALKELAADQEPYPDDVLFAILRDVAEMNGVADHAIAALTAAA